MIAGYLEEFVILEHPEYPLLAASGPLLAIVKR